MPQLDVFDSDTFSMHTLTATINKLKYQPMRLGQLTLFQEAGVRTTSTGPARSRPRFTGRRVVIPW